MNQRFRRKEKWRTSNTAICPPAMARGTATRRPLAQKPSHSPGVVRWSPRRLVMWVSRCKTAPWMWRNLEFGPENHRRPFITRAGWFTQPKNILSWYGSAFWWYLASVWGQWYFVFWKKLILKLIKIDKNCCFFTLCVHQMNPEQNVSQKYEAA